MEQKEEYQMGMFCHLAALVGILIPFGNVIGPLVLWMIKKEESEFVDYHGKESLNFQITVAIALFISALLTIVIIGIVLFPIVAIGSLILTIMAGLSAQKGEHYKYPFAIRFIK